MYDQITKKKIDVGELGNANTGDILYDGGDKLNEFIDNTYNAFGDQRMYDNKIDIGNQTIHATGYYQKVDRTAFRTPVKTGTMWDVDALSGGLKPILGISKRGEQVKFINSNGSLSVTNPLIIQPSGSIIGVLDGLTITKPYTKVVMTCVSDDGGRNIWNYSISSMFGDNQIPVEGTWVLSKSNIDIKIGHISEFNSIKLFTTAASNDGSKLRQSEINILVDTVKKAIYNTEYAVLRVGNTSEDDEIVDIKFDIDLNNILIMQVKSEHPNIKLAIKSIAAQKIGSGQ